MSIRINLAVLSCSRRCPRRSHSWLIPAAVYRSGMPKPAWEAGPNTIARAVFWFKCNLDRVACRAGAWMYVHWEFDKDNIGREKTSWDESIARMPSTRPLWSTLRKGYS
jgi:hypothetical protein